MDVTDHKVTVIVQLAQSEVAAVPEAFHGLYIADLVHIVVVDRSFVNQIKKAIEESFSGVRLGIVNQLVSGLLQETGLQFLLVHVVTHISSNGGRHTLLETA